MTLLIATRLVVQRAFVFRQEESEGNLPCKETSINKITDILSTELAHCFAALDLTYERYNTSYTKLLTTKHLDHFYP